jgi:Domain of unknown function (DUF4267)
MGYACAAVGVILCLIGVRFLLFPEAAARFFGVGARSADPAFHHIIGLRDLWLGGLAIALAWFREWRSLALWLALGAAVCLGDAAIVAGAGGKWHAIAFHLISGVLCAALAAATWRRSSP